MTDDFVKYTGHEPLTIAPADKAFGRGYTLDTMDTPNLKVGDRVVLKAGGPVLCVAKIDGDHIECIWFDDDADLQSSTFPKETLKEAG